MNERDFPIFNEKNHNNKVIYFPLKKKERHLT